MPWGRERPGVIRYLQDSSALSAVDLLICATAAQRDLVVLHDDNDFATAARHVPDLRERTIRDVPPTD